jgi:hypothetical protein
LILLICSIGIFDLENQPELLFARKARTYLLSKDTFLDITTGLKGTTGYTANI